MVNGHLGVPMEDAANLVQVDKRLDQDHAAIQHQNTMGLHVQEAQLNQPHATLKTAQVSFK